MSHSTRYKLEQVMKQQFQEGYKAGVDTTFKVIYCAILIAARKTYKFGDKRGLRLLRAVDKEVTSGMYIDGDEAVRKLKEDYGITLSFKGQTDPLAEEDHIRKVDKKK